ncbi:hypothetical protein OSB04_030760 [Centaurea solstitialis]|uniref:Protein TIC 214 n=1 Tax=Centaurea solstitialis TaxID=347529 RepID=A0AA38VTM6_9ASTR|nr:hypothetical protein OSB04_030760 [Centaurea solstitialis]
MKIINSVVVVGLYYGFLTTFSIGPSYLFLLRAHDFDIDKSLSSPWLPRISQVLVWILDNSSISYRNVCESGFKGIQLILADHDQGYHYVSRSPLNCLHGDSDSIFPAFLRSACEMESFIGGYGNEIPQDVYILHYDTQLNHSTQNEWWLPEVDFARNLNSDCGRNGMIGR